MIIQDGGVHGGPCGGPWFPCSGLETLRWILYFLSSSLTMPLIIITGVPCSGKTTRTSELKEYFENKAGKNVEVISEVDVLMKAGYDRNTFYAG